MKLVIDVSVLVHASQNGGGDCLRCLRAIYDNNSIFLVRHSQWATDVYESHSSLSNEIIEWKGLMSNRLKPCQSGEKHLFEPQIDWQHERLYLLTMAHQWDRLVLYCSVETPDCYGFSTYDHPDFAAIKWLSTHGTHDLLEWLKSCQ